VINNARQVKNLGQNQQVHDKEDAVDPGIGGIRCVCFYTSGFDVHTGSG